MNVDYYFLPDDSRRWNENDHQYYNGSYKNYHELKLRISKDLPFLYDEVTSNLDVIKVLDEDINLAVILAMSNKLSHEHKHFRVTILMQGSERLRPKVIGYVYRGVEDDYSFL